MNLTNEIEEVELAPGARFQLRKPTAVRRMAVDSAAQEAAVRLSQGAAVLEDYGFASDDFGLLSDRHVFAGLLVFFRACAWGDALIVGWSFDGVDEPPAVSPEMVRKVLNLGVGDHPPMYEALLTWAEKPFRSRRAEGNVYAPAPNGSSAAGASSAGPAR